MVLYVILIYYSFGLLMVVEVVFWVVVFWFVGGFCVCDVLVRGCGVVLFVVEFFCKKIILKIMKVMYLF